MKILLMNTYSKEYFERACSGLKENNISYTVKIQDINNRNGLFGLDNVTLLSVPAKRKETVQSLCVRKRAFTCKENT